MRKGIPYYDDHAPEGTEEGWAARRLQRTQDYTTDISERPTQAEVDRECRGALAIYMSNQPAHGDLWLAGLLADAKRRAG